MNLKLFKGYNALFEQFDNYEIDDVVVVDRKNVAQKL
jgi:hypothetical protein